MRRQKARLNEDKACRGKRAYRTVQQAQAAQARSEKMSGEVLNWYKCILCRRYHLGHIPYWRQG